MQSTSPGYLVSSMSDKKFDPGWAAHVLYFLHVVERPDVSTIRGKADAAVDAGCAPVFIVLIIIDLYVVFELARMVLHHV